MSFLSASVFCDEDCKVMSIFVVRWFTVLSVAKNIGSSNNNLWNTILYSKPLYKKDCLIHSTDPSWVSWNYGSMKTVHWKMSVCWSWLGLVVHEEMDKEDTRTTSYRWLLYVVFIELAVKKVQGCQWTPRLNNFRMWITYFIIVASREMELWISLEFM